MGTSDEIEEFEGKEGENTIMPEREEWL